MLKFAPIKTFTYISSLILLIFSSHFVQAQEGINQWVDSVYNSLSQEQKIGQLFMVAAYSGTSKYNEQEIKSLIRNQHIGGLIFMQGTASKQASLTNQYQRMSRVPLLIGMDAEWGLGMRLKGIKDLPKQMFLGAAYDEALMKKYGQAVAAQCNRLGVHINFAPVIDVNNNPKNPVINSRSFGENKKMVSKLGIAYMRAMQDRGVMACAKHFPGHGDTDVDSHKDLPQINKSKEQLSQTEFYPFRELIKNDVQSMMIAHLNIPSLEPKNNLPTTLSYNVVTNLLQKEMGYRGLIITDALNMKGVTKYYKPGEVDYLAFKAGNDVLLFSEDVATGVQKIKTAIENKEISNKRLEQSVKKILQAKYNAQLNRRSIINSANIDKDINRKTSALRKETAQQGITLVSDPHNVLNKIRKGNGKTAYVFVGTSQNSQMANALKKNGIQNIFYANTSTEEKITKLQSKLAKYNAVVIGVHNMSRYPSKKYGLDFGERKAIKRFAENNNTLTILFGNPYAIPMIDNRGGFMVSYNEHDETIDASIDILTSKSAPNGKLPVTVTNDYKIGTGILSNTGVKGTRTIVIDDNSEFANRVIQKKNKKIVQEGSAFRANAIQQNVSPASVGANSVTLGKIDQVIMNGINKRAFPGCRVIATKNGKVFYDRSYGHQTYSKKVPVTSNTVYDLASVTKIAATTIAVMKLYEEGKINLNASLGTYLPRARGTNKRNVKIKNLLLHQGGLHAWIPFYKETLNDNGYGKSEIYRSKPSSLYSVKVMNGMYMNRRWVDTMWKRIYDSKLTNLGRYKYSDLDFIFLQKVVERVSGMPLDKYVAKHFYTPLRMNDTKFNPRRIPSKNPIAPSEYDNYWRHKRVQGYVHDMGAAMFGGVSGHAGLFSTAQDMSVLMQMLINGGTYNGRRYLKKSTINLFTAKNSFISRRGLGFDKPQPNLNKAQPTSKNCSLKTFGHTGFTGTCVWADPVHDVQFIFLSNRTYPSSKYNLLSRMDIREKAQKYVYQALGITR